MFHVNSAGDIIWEIIMFVFKWYESSALWGGDVLSRFGDAETGQSIRSSCQGRRRSVKADQHTCGTGKSLLYMTRDSQSPLVRSHGFCLWSNCIDCFSIWFENWVSDVFFFFLIIPGELLDKLSVIKSTNLLEGASRYHLFLFPFVNQWL